MSKFDTTARFSPEEAHLSRAFCESGNTFYIKKKRIHFGEKTEKLGIYHYLVASPTYLPVLCTAEFLVEILSHGINQERVFHPAPGKHVPHQTDPPRPAIHALADAIVWVCAWIMSIWLLEGYLDLRWTEFQAHPFSLLTVLFSNGSPDPQQGVLHVPQHPAHRSSHHCQRDKTTRTCPSQNRRVHLLSSQRIKVLSRSCI